MNFVLFGAAFLILSVALRFVYRSYTGVCVRSAKNLLVLVRVESETGWSVTYW